MYISTFTKSISIFFLAFILNTNGLFAQANNECAGAVQIVDPSNFCSPLNAVNNLFATASNVPLPGCFASAEHDIWFWFIAQAPNVVIVINGASISAGGSLIAPEVALYEGSCDALDLLGCATDFSLAGITELHVNDLIPGNKYFFRVDGQIPGTFQYCVRNFFFEGNISGDCPTAIVLCDKSPFNVQAVAGPGNDPLEMDDATCFGGTNIEFNSAWYAFTAANNGTLEFTLTPNNPVDDIDFAVYRLPNGIGDCSGKILERCMAAGDFIFPSPCMGPTGLNAASTATEHAPGCVTPDDNNFLRFMDLQAGSSYVLVVNNFSASGNGFQVNWGGTAEFTGPNAGILINPDKDMFCLGDTIRFSDATTFNQGILTDWGWTFGEGASQSSATTPGPLDIVYQTVGQKTISLTVKSSLGCEVSASRQLTIGNCCPLVVSVQVTPSCQSNAGASAEVLVDSAALPLTYLWSNGQVGPTLTGIASGNYSVTVTDAGGCQQSIDFVVPPPVNFSAVFPMDTVILTGTNATLMVAINNPEVQVTWSSSGNTVTGNPVTLQPAETTAYLVTAAVGDCSETDSVIVTVRDHLFEVPNAFTPNNDQINDRFRPVLYAGSVVNMTIWSRWGELVYEGNSPNGWDGTFDGELAPSDVYVFQLLIKLPNGVEEKRHGDVTLIR